MKPNRVRILTLRRGRVVEAFTLNETSLREAISELKTREERIRNHRQDLEAQLFALVAKKRLSSMKIDDIKCVPSG